MHQDGEEVQPGDENLLIRSDPAGPGAGLQGRVRREQLPADLDAEELQQEPAADLAGSRRIHHPGPSDRVPRPDAGCRDQGDLPLDQTAVPPHSPVA